jgi:hypothetical protein
VNYEILLLKLKFYGIKGNFFKLIKTYLENRFQKVQIYTEHCKKVTSNNWRIVSHGVPEGSIFGPLLFLLYINDLPSILQPYTSPVLFADDTSIILKNNTTNDFLKNCRETFTKLNIWFISNELFLNYEKTNFLQFRTKNSSSFDINLTFDNKTTENKNHTKFLGITLDSTLKWSEHIESITPKLNAACYALRKLKHIVSTNNTHGILFIHSFYYVIRHNFLDNFTI